MERRQTVLDRAVDAVVADPEADVTADVERAQTYERLLEALDGSDRYRRVAAVIGFSCVMIIGAAQVVRVPTTRVTLSAEATSATFTLSESWIWESHASRAVAIRLVNFDEVDLGAQISAKLVYAEHNTLDLEGSGLTVGSLSIAPEARVTLETDEGATDVFVKGGEVAGQLTLVGGVMVSSGVVPVGSDSASARFDLPLPEIVEFASRPAGAVPAQLRIERQDPVVLFGVGVRSLSFERELPSGRGFESTIRDGRVVIAETRKEVPLRRGDHIEIGEASDGRLVDVSISDALTIAFEGRVGRVELVQAGVRTDLRPTLLEYVYHNERLVFIWSALGVVWGLAWSVRRALG